MSNLFTSVRYLKGIGEARAAQLAGLGIETLYDLLAYFPRAYEDRTRLVPIHQLEVDVPACFEATVISNPRTHHIRKGLDLTKVTVADDTGRLNLTFFNQNYVTNNLLYGETYIFYGTVTGDYTGYQMQNPVFERPDSPAVATRRILPIYGLTAGITNNLLVKAVAQAMNACLAELPDILPEELRQKYHLCDARSAYAVVHNPPDFETLAVAKRRLVFEEFFIFSIGLGLLREKRQTVSPYPCPKDIPAAFFDALPFTLTGAQQRAIGEIRRDLASGQPMNRLVQGDVGSGKTMVAAAAIACAAENGLQSALMAPTEILAEQHFQSLSALLEPLGIRTVLVTGSQRTAQRREALVALSSGEAQLAVGTHALLSDTSTFHRLGLVVADEQHRFGVAQRAALAQKGDHPHVLVMSATPIPRTLALVVYGDLDVSVMDELPPGRQEIDTFLVGESMRRRINAFIRKQVDAGHQVYIVCPAVEESDVEDLKSAEAWADALQRTVFPDLRVALLHGKMKGAEKENIMSTFSRGEIDILVATTVIEVGVDVPNATLMVIENAERFGLSQLHQLRGRVGRGKDKSYCVLFTNNRNLQTLERLKAFTKTNDGFKIAEEDLKLRGPGDFFGARQHGLPVFKCADLAQDTEVLVQAREAANEFLANEDYVNQPVYQDLYERIRAMFSEGSTVL
jgi:ATP-dependent DNA helicase RecG